MEETQRNKEGQKQIKRKQSPFKVRSTLIVLTVSPSGSDCGRRLQADG